MRSPTKSDTIDLGLRLLDHQLRGEKDEFVGKVDNLVLDQAKGQLTVIGVVSGPAGLGPRIKGRPGYWMLAIWRRLRRESRPQPLVLPMRHVRKLGSAVQISDWAVQALLTDSLLENWLRLHVVSRIPGAKADSDRLAGESMAPTQAADRHPELRLRAASHLISDLIGASVRTAGGQSAGFVLEVTASVAKSMGDDVGELPVTALVYGRHRLGAELGYTSEARQGPWVIAWALKAWHRGDRRVPISDVNNIDWDNGIVTLTSEPHTTHPHTKS